MARRSRTDDPKHLRAELDRILGEFEQQLETGNLRDQVRAFIPAARVVRDLGGSIIAPNRKSSAKQRILEYFRAHVGTVVAGEELMIVSGISDYPRRIRELRKEEGWPILSGVAAKQMQSAARDPGAVPARFMAPMQADDYVLLEDVQDEDAARRWELANSIRRGRDGVQSKVLAYLRANVGKHVTGEELRYVANERNEWPRRVRELRTEEGWPIVTRFSGDPSLPVGIYVLAEDKQAPPHDRHIKEIVRREVMERDDWRCQWKGCGWSHERLARDPRFLEVHHIRQHAAGGGNEAENLVTLCNLHHDEAHRSGVLTLEDGRRGLVR